MSGSAPKASVRGLAELERGTNVNQKSQPNPRLQMPAMVTVPRAMCVSHRIVFQTLAPANKKSGRRERPECRTWREPDESHLQAGHKPSASRVLGRGSRISFVFSSYSHRILLVFSSYFARVQPWGFCPRCGVPTGPQLSLDGTGLQAAQTGSHFFKYPNRERIGFANEG